MAVKSGVGATVSFNSSSVAGVTAITFTDNGNPIDVTALGDASHLYEVGISDLECQIEIVGASTIVKGNSGALTVTWLSGVTTTISSAIVTNKVETTGVDSKITTTLTLKPKAS